MLLINVNFYAQDITLNTQEEIDNFSQNYPDLIEVIGDLTITGNDIQNLSGLIQIKVVGGLKIISCSSLLNLNGLNSLESIGWWLEISNNNQLTSFVDFESLIHFGKINADHFFIIENNPVLEDLIGLDKINFELIYNNSWINVVLEITENPNLSICSYDNLCEFVSFLENNPYPSNNINNNGEGCETLLEFLNNCSLGLKDEYLKKLNSYPNPTKDILTINGIKENYELSLFDISGRQVLYQKNKNKIDLKGFRSGVYFLIVNKDGHKISKKIIKQ
jgi:hypothetical protein